MCGIIFTLSRPHYHKDFDEFIGDGFLTSQVRGTDSSGLFRVTHPFQRGNTKDRSVLVHKKALDATCFLRHHTTTNLIKAATCAAAFVGHVRARTHGAITDGNAHPFEVLRGDGSELYGVHNGSLLGWHEMIEGDEYAVDSEWMYNKLADDGIDAFRGFNGAYAMVWYDTADPNTISIARNEKRTLFFAWTKDSQGNKQGMIGASELGMLGWLADRNNLSLWTNEKGKSFFYFTPETQFRISLETMEIVETIALPKFDKENNPYKDPNPRPAAQYNQVALPAYQHNPYNYRYDQAHVLSVTTRILTESREKRQAPSTQLALVQDDGEVVTTEDLVDGGEIAATVTGLMQIAGVEPGKKMDYLVEVNATCCSRKEIDLAKSLGYFGLTGTAWPYYHDSDTQELSCGFNPGAKKEGGATAYSEDAVIRFVKTSMAEEGGVYHDNHINKQRFAIAGVIKCEPKNSAPHPTLILVPVTEKNKVIQRTIADNQAAANASSTTH